MPSPAYLKSASSPFASGTKPFHIFHYARRSRVLHIETISQRRVVVPPAKKDGDAAVQDKPRKGAGLGDLLGPIGLSLGSSDKEQVLLDFQTLRVIFTIMFSCYWPLESGKQLILAGYNK